MDTFFTTPEEEIIRQDSRGRELFFLSKGDCLVNVTFNHRDHVAWRLLVEGQHFGDISLLYDCRRTASVVSRNFNTFGRLNYPGYRSVVNKFPFFQALLKKYVAHYQDPLKDFLMASLKKVPHLTQALTHSHLSELLYSFRPVYFNEGQHILQQDSTADHMLLIERGEVEVYFVNEGHEFVLDVLYAGAIINPIQFLLEDKTMVSFRCRTVTLLRCLSRTDVRAISQTSPDYSKALQSFVYNMLKKEKPIYLDYIHKVPLLRIPRSVSEKDYHAMMRRRQVLKNVVLRRVLEIRELGKVNLGSFVEIVRAQHTPEMKKQFVARLRKMYQNQETQKDLKFQFILSFLNRHIVQQGVVD
jgi:CRP-like cAMP-binding protein